MKPVTPICVVKAIEFFDLVTGLGLSGKMTPFNLHENPELTVSHKRGGKIVIETKATSLIIDQDATIKIFPNGQISWFRGPSKFDNMWDKLIATSVLALKRHGLVFDREKVWIERHQTAITFDSNKEFLERETNVDRGGVFLEGYDVIVVKDPSGPSKAIVRDKNSATSFGWLEGYIKDHATIQESGAFDHVRLDAETRRNAKMAEDQARSARSREKWSLVGKLDINTPVLIEVDGKKLTVRKGTIYRGNKLGGSKLDLDTAFDTGLLHQVVKQVDQRLAANAM